MAEQYEAVLFDFDGVIVDSEPVHFDCWREIVAEHGLSLDWNTYLEQGIGLPDRNLLGHLCSQLDPAYDVSRLIAEYPRKKQMFLARMRADPHVSPELLELIADLARNYKLAVVSSSGRSEVEPLLESAGLLPSFAAGVYGGDVKRKKPDPEPYLLALNRLGVRRALVVEDSDAGAASGTAAGLDVLRVAGPQDVPHLVREALAKRAI